MLEGIKKVKETLGMDAELGKKPEEQRGSEKTQDADDKLKKADVDEVAGGARTPSDDGPIELPAI